MSGWWSGIILADCLPLLFCGVMMMTMMLRMLISPGDDSRGADVRLVGWVGWCLSRRQALRLPAGSAILKTSELPSPCSKFLFSFFLPPPPFPPLFPVTEEKNVKLSNCAVKLTPETVILVLVTAPPGSAAAPGADSRVGRLIRSKMNVLIKNPALFFFLFLPSSLGKVFYFV